MRERERERERKGKKKLLSCLNFQTRKSKSRYAKVRKIFLSLFCDECFGSLWKKGEREMFRKNTKIQKVQSKFEWELLKKSSVVLKSAIHQYRSFNSPFLSLSLSPITPWFDPVAKEIWILNLLVEKDDMKMKNFSLSLSLSLSQS